VSIVRRHPLHAAIVALVIVGLAVSTSVVSAQYRNIASYKCGAGYSCSPHTIIPEAGEGQVVKAGKAFPEHLSVKVLDSSGAGVADETVTFKVESGDARFDGSKSESARTDKQGVATASTLKAGDSAGEVVVEATVSGLSKHATFDEVIIKKTAKADLKIDITGATKVKDREEFSETVHVSNEGPSAAYGLLSGIRVPGGTTVVSTDGGARSGDDIIWTKADLRDGGSVSYKVTFKVDKGVHRTADIAAGTESDDSTPKTASIKVHLGA
jgi:hypothetical protein